MVESNVIETEENKEVNPTYFTGLRKVRLENVQSIADLTLDFENKGVYRLVGDNDVGKSAILRGINALFHNVSRSSYKEYISDWADTFVVEAWFYDGGYVKLSRGGDDYYEYSLPNGISDTVFKTDGKVPKELEDYFNLYFEKDKTKTTLNFNLQGDILPFVDSTSSDNFWLTQKALGTNSLLNASKLLKTENRDLTKEMKTILENIEYEKDLTVKILNEIENDEDEVRMLETGIKVINEEYDELKEIEHVYMLESEIIMKEYLFDNLVVLSNNEIQQLSNLITELTTIQKYFDTLKQVDKIYDNLNTLTEKIENFNISDLEIKEKELSLLENIYSKELEKNIIDNKITGMLVIPNEEISEIEKQLLEIDNLEKILVLKNQEIYSELEITTLEQKTDTIANTIVSIEKEINDLLEQEKVCPVCGNDLLSSKLHTHKE